MLPLQLDPQHHDHVGAGNRLVHVRGQRHARRDLAEESRGPYASEALGRVMLGVARVSGRAAARELAQEYLERFPNGTYLLHARQILAAP